MPVAAVKRLIEVQQGLDAVMARGNLAQALERITRGRGVDRRPPGRAEDRSTSMPKICWVLGLSLIWKRGSSLGSVESMTSSRPSSGVLLRSAAEADTELDSLVFLGIISSMQRGARSEKRRRECDRQRCGRD